MICFNIPFPSLDIYTWDAFLIQLKQYNHVLLSHVKNPNRFSPFHSGSIVEARLRESESQDGENGGRDWEKAVCRTKKWRTRLGEGVLKDRENEGRYWEKACCRTMKMADETERRRIAGR